MSASRRIRVGVGAERTAGKQGPAGEGLTPCAPATLHVDDGECWAPEEDYGLQGGQGREPRDLDAAAGIMAAVGLMIGLAVVVAVAWWALFQIAVQR